MCGKRRNLLHSGRRTSVQLIRNKIFVSKEFDIFLQKKIGYKKMDAFGVREILAKKCFTKMSPPVAWPTGFFFGGGGCGGAIFQIFSIFSFILNFVYPACFLLTLLLYANGGLLFWFQGVTITPARLVVKRVSQIPLLVLMALGAMWIKTSRFSFYSFTFIFAWWGNNFILLFIFN